MNHIRNLKRLCSLLVALAPMMSRGVGLAAIKEQTFHSDASADIVVYEEIRDYGVPVVTIKTKNREFTLERQKLVATLLIEDTTPLRMTSPDEIAPLRERLVKLQAFSKRFPKSQPILASRVTKLEAIIKSYDTGHIYENSAWITREEFEAKQQESRLATQDASQRESKRLAREAAWKKEARAEEARLQAYKKAFVKSQHAKGLKEYKNQWLKATEADELLERDRLAEERAADRARIEKEAEETAAIVRQVQAEAQRKKEEESNYDGLIYMRKSVKGVTNEYGTTITGIIENRTGRDIRMVKIEFILYDANDAQIGSGEDYISNLEAGGKWSFKVTSLDKASSHKLLHISTR